MPDGDSIAGYGLTGRSRVGEVGTWTDTVGPDGSRGGALRLDPRALSAPGARERVVAAVTEDRRLARSGLTGLMPVTDLVAARQEVWLLTGVPAAPTLAELMDGRPGGPSPDAGSAATILVETAQTLLTVHSAGLSHGALHAGTVVVGEDGTALLAERGLALALRGEPASPDRDLTAWASLARGLAAGWAAGDPRAAQLFDRAASTATTHGLGSARDYLLNGRDLLPAGFITRERLVRSIQWWSASDVPTQSPPPAAPGYGDTGGQGSEGEVVTLLYTPGAGDQPFQGTPASGAAGYGASPPAGYGAPPGTTGPTGPTGPAGQGETGRGDLRFGPGVPVDTTAAQIWRAGREQQQITVPASERLGRMPARRRRRGGVLWSAVVLALIVAAGLFLWFQRGAPLSVTAVDVKVPKAKGCDITVNVVGVITTNGAAGQVTYEWLPSGERPVKHTEPVSSGESAHQVSLKWEIGGQGTRKLTARLRVLSPLTPGTRLDDKASFTYKC
ncbi:protein kinase family protein [Sphaerisporangium corydalis]|uniref:Ig-like domain-containing protein n=1 Tax=Sphaerisporangium corydalis TaxID=1441875 RepID=A0ABV9E9J0_9ACTN|nr:hypothetical protein [Sphaerisporangium corydalis]